MKTVKHTLTENSIVLIISTALVKIIGAIFKIPLATDAFLGDIGFGYFSVAHDIFMPFYILQAFICWIPLWKWMRLLSGE